MHNHFICYKLFLLYTCILVCPRAGPNVENHPISQTLWIVLIFFLHNTILLLFCVFFINIVIKDCLNVIKNELREVFQKAPLTHRGVPLCLVRGPPTKYSINV